MCKKVEELSILTGLVPDDLKTSSRSKTNELISVPGSPVRSHSSLWIATVLWTALGDLDIRLR